MPPRLAGRPLLLDAAVGLILLSGFCALVWWVFANLDNPMQWGRVWSYRGSLWNGWFMTLVISAGALPGSCLVAAIFIAGSRAPLSSVRRLTRAIVELIRGMPLLALVIISYYLIFAQRQVSDVLDSIGLGSKMFAGIALLSIFTAAYLSEILRGGLESIPHGQIDSARAVGFDRWQVLRFVIMPQALRRVLPALAGQFVDLVKSSSLLSVIGIQEFTYMARAYNSATYGGIEAFLFLAVGYLAINLPLAWFAHWMEKRFRYQM